MISVDDALHAVLANTRSSSTKVVPVDDALGYVLAKDILSPVDLPPFHQSAMDGYAIRFEDLANGNKLKIIGESSAGKSFRDKLNLNEAIRIFTGAEVPPGSDTVVIQEKVSIVEGRLKIHDESLKRGLNIRAKNSQIRKNELALANGSLINAATVGFLASMGIKEVKVYAKPSITIIVTGNELIQPGKKLPKGFIYESNSITLKIALFKEGIHSIFIQHVKDNEKNIHAAFRKALLKSNYVLFSGGISVGDYDFVRSVLEKENVKEIFYRVRQKPGGPLYFGMKKKKYVFGLPGNPASVLTCFYEYVLPSVRKFSGREHAVLPQILLPLNEKVIKKRGTTCFLKGWTDFKTVTPLEGQESYIMRSFAKANCLIKIPEDKVELDTNEMVEIHLID